MVVPSADVFLHTSSTEVWGLVFNEAMSKGCPIIATNHCVGAMELVADGENGYLIDVGNVEDLKVKMFKIISDDKLRQSMMKKSIVRISEYTYENLAKTHMDIFEKSLQS